MTLPKIVVPNRLTREQGVAGMNILDVPLYKVISGGNNNWALRQVAHGRTVQWENFRSRQEAIFCGVLMRALRSDQAEQEGTDFVTVLNASQKKYFPASDLHDWTAWYNTIKRLAQDMIKEFRKKAPVQTNQTLLTRLQTLESENARLKGQASRSTRADPNPNPSRRKGASKVRSAPPSTVEDPPEDDGAETAHFGSPPPLEENLFESPYRENDQDTGPSVLFLENCNIDATTLKGVSAWLASTALGKGKNEATDTAAAEFVAACSKLDDGSKKPVDKIAVEWGLSVPPAAKLNGKCLIRLIAGAHLLASQ